MFCGHRLDYGRRIKMASSIQNVTIDLSTRVQSSSQILRTELWGKIIFDITHTRTWNTGIMAVSCLTRYLWRHCSNGDEIPQVDSTSPNHAISSSVLLINEHKQAYVTWHASRSRRAAKVTKHVSSERQSASALRSRRSHRLKTCRLTSTHRAAGTTLFKIRKESCGKWKCHFQCLARRLELRNLRNCWDWAHAKAATRKIESCAKENSHARRFDHTRLTAFIHGRLQKSSRRVAQNEDTRWFLHCWDQEFWVRTCNAMDSCGRLKLPHLLRR